MLNASKLILIILTLFKTEYSLILSIYYINVKVLSTESTRSLKMLGCFNPTLGQIWTNPNIGLKM